MDFDLFVDFVKAAIEEDEKERIHSQWCSMLPYMSLQRLEYIPFDEYYDKCTGKNIDLRPTEEVIADIMMTHAKAKGGGM